METFDVATSRVLANEAEDELAREAMFADSVSGSRARVERFEERLVEVVPSLARRVVEGVVGADRGEERADGDLVVGRFDLGFEDAEAVEVLDGVGLETEGYVDPVVEAATEGLEVAIVRARLSKPHRFGVVVVGERAGAAGGGLEREGTFEQSDGFVWALELTEGERDRVGEYEARAKGVVVEGRELGRVLGEGVPRVAAEELTGVGVVGFEGGLGSTSGHISETPPGGDF